ncbi:Uncharacterised protein [Streptococcus pseudoporcinus]|uniref:Uncharacterized protein n=1 Tax=Streptococcus pseudoporcinus TaxID=361101 RepID=A0A4U9XTR9_9STRE|nr:Uncharacterised protein [Streptococcus pseudoporcinus]VUC68202.1 Uncharacterised protein [Streptococcus pseudoporcinus]VUC99061.1 Uncharacterised protein [Streptococcus pseudoporcinus]VUC99453.1 Uncharacterised protein [Streptococcus pseudoporcinus]
MSLSQVARLEEKVNKQAEKVAKEEERLKIYQNQLQEAMYSTFITYHASSQIRFDVALERAFGKLSKPHTLQESNDIRRTE